MTRFVRDSELRELQKDSRSGIYYVRKKVKGKKPLLESTGFKDRTRARKYALEALARYLSAEPTLAESNPTFREIAQKILALKASKSQATRDLAENRIRLHLGPYFGHMDISKVSENTWEQYIVREQMASKRTLADDAKIMMSIMRYAFQEGLLKRKVKVRNPDPPNEEGTAYSVEEIQKLLDAASTPEMKLQIKMGYTMGMRHGEIAGCMWEWIDFDKASIKLPPVITKTRRGRIVPINQGVLGDLRARKAISSTPHVFPSSKDPTKPIPDFDSQWNRTWLRAGIKGRFHFLRHTCITNMAARGIPESTIKKIVGCSARTMAKVYVHLKDDLAYKAVNSDSSELGQGGTSEMTPE